MTSVQSPAKRAEGNGSAPAGLRLTRPRDRKMPWVALGVLVIAGSALAFGNWSSSLSQRELVVIAAADIKQGSVVTDRDLRTARVALEGPVEAIAATRMRSLVGRVAATPVPRGALIHPSQLTDGPVVGPGEAVVGAALPPGAIPIETLRVGDSVQVVEVSAPNSDGGAGGRVLVVAQVYALRELDDASRTVVVSLRVPASNAPTVADAAAANRVRLVLLGGG